MTLVVHSVITVSHHEVVLDSNLNLFDFFLEEDRVGADNNIHAVVLLLVERGSQLAGEGHIQNTESQETFLVIETLSEIGRQKFVIGFTISFFKQVASVITPEFIVLNMTVTVR
jgi:hypothetical protein